MTEYYTDDELKKLHGFDKEKELVVRMAEDIASDPDKAWVEWVMVFERQIEKLLKNQLFNLHVTFDKGGHHRVFDAAVLEITKLFIGRIHEHAWKVNDRYVRNMIVHEMNRWPAASHRMSYMVVCDESNNLPDDLDDNKLRATFFLRLGGYDTRFELLVVPVPLVPVVEGEKG